MEKKSFIQQPIRSTNDNLELSSSIPVQTMKSIDDTNESRVLFYELQIDESQLKKYISELNLVTKDQYEIEYDIKVIQNAIKSDYYGYDYIFNLKSYRQSFGESIHVNNLQIKRILCYKKEVIKLSKNKINSNHQKMSYFNHIIDNFNFGYKSYPIILGKLDDQQDSDVIHYDISLDSITFKINVENLTSGKYKIQIYNSSKYLIFQYSFIIFSSTKNLQNKIKMFTFNTTNPNVFTKPKTFSSNLLHPQRISILQNSLDSSRRQLNRDKDATIQSIIKNQNSNRSKVKNVITFDNESQYHFF